MLKQPKDIQYREEFAAPGEGPVNAGLWLKCAKAILGYDPGFVVRKSGENAEKTAGANNKKDLPERKVV